MSRFKEIVVLAALIVLPSVVYAAEGTAGIAGMTKFNTLVSTTVTWITGLALLLGIGGFVRAGIKWMAADQDAWEKTKGAFIGSAIVAGGSVIVGFIKGFFATSGG
jgi:hypothetical protein